jgi:hypothetical protein
MSFAGAVSDLALSPTFLGSSSIYGVVNPVEPTESSAVVPNNALSELNAEFAESSEADDGAPANQLARLYAERVIRALSPEYEPSDVYFDHVGSAVLEWHPVPGRAAMVRIDGVGGIRFSVNRHGSLTQGRVSWNQTLSPELMVPLRRLLR